MRARLQTFWIVKLTKKSLALKTNKYLLLSIGWALLIALLSLLPSSNLPKTNVTHVDKIGHLVFYAILCIFIALYFIKESKNGLFKARALLLAVILSVGYGMILEVLQREYASDRLFDWYDALANTIGGLIGVILLKLRLVKVKK